MLVSTTTKHQSEFNFEANLEGTSFQFGVPLSASGSGNGVSSKYILLNTLTASIGVDIMAIINKMNVLFPNFEIKVEGQLTETRPKYFKKINLSYELTTTEANLEKLKKL